ncbi:hypothetical protein [Streptomyces lycii]|uniref:Lipoprotein n=1 Tax=Streptomyces lycii TaxID=2654337 RepID=A0ABQ7FS98_9ACTN|nr:hypothetical protein [Streptomyces lycii]KAF4410498.1 hypothetical protein GCU69_03655 [Streptomyces lycii]
MGDPADLRRHLVRRAFRARYGASPAHLLLLLASFALTLYAGTRLLDGSRPVAVLLWFAGAAVLHDLVLVPLCSAADRVLHALLPASRGRAPAATDAVRVLNHIRVPALLSGLLLLVWWPLVLGPPAGYEGSTGLGGEVFAGRWLLITAGLFAASAVWLLLGVLRRGARRVPAPGPETADR